MFVPVAAELLGEYIKRGKIPRRGSVVELGNQTYSIDGSVIKEIIKSVSSEPGCVGQYGIDMEKLELLSHRKPAKHPKEVGVPHVKDFFDALGFSSYSSIDINGDFDSIVMDLNIDIREKYGFNKTFDLVTNIGVSEHLFAQEHFFKNMHNLTKVNGIMFHVLPFLGHINHGFYNYEPRLFYDLAGANNYELIGLYLTERDRVLSNLLVPSEILVHFHQYLPFLIRNHLSNGFVAAILRKTKDSAFVTPLQGKYIKDIGSKEIEEIYGGQNIPPSYPPPKAMFPLPAEISLRLRVKKKLLKMLHNAMRTVLGSF